MVEHAREAETLCLLSNVTYHHRIDNPDGWNWCLVPDGGPDAVFFAAIAILVMCLANPRWDALITLFVGAVYEVFAFKFNLGHVSNAVALWLGMRPSDIFIYVFLPPFLLDLAIRIDFFMLKKVAFNVIVMAFVMVITSTLVLIPFMLYGLNLQASGWTAGYVALFGAMIASTDAAAVSACLSSGGGPEILSVILEGESLFNDASSLTLFEIYKEVVEDDHASSFGHDVSTIVVDTLYAAATAVCIGCALGIVNKYINLWLQYRNMEAQSEVAFTVAGCYLSFYIAQVWCHGSGCIAAVTYGLVGSASLTWGISSKARQDGTFREFWKVLTFIINGLIFFYVGAASVNFTWRSTETLYSNTGGVELAEVVLYKLPIIYLVMFALRGGFLFISFKLLKFLRLSNGLPWQQVVFITVGGLRGSLSLVLAETVATLASTHPEDKRVKAEIAIYTTGFVLLTLLINAPLCGPLMTWLGLDRVSEEQLHMRRQVKSMFSRYTTSSIDDLKAEQEDDEMLQGVDWSVVEKHVDFSKELDHELPSVQPTIPFWGRIKRAMCLLPNFVRTTVKKQTVARADTRVLRKAASLATSSTRRLANAAGDLSRITRWSLVANKQQLKEPEEEEEDAGSSDAGPAPVFYISNVTCDAPERTSNQRRNRPQTGPSGLLRANTLLTQGSMRQPASVKKPFFANPASNQFETMASAGRRTGKLGEEAPDSMHRKTPTFHRSSSSAARTSANASSQPLRKTMSMARNSLASAAAAVATVGTALGRASRDSLGRASRGALGRPSKDSSWQQQQPPPGWPYNPEYNAVDAPSLPIVNENGGAVQADADVETPGAGGAQPAGTVSPDAVFVDIPPQAADDVIAGDSRPTQQLHAITSGGEQALQGSALRSSPPNVTIPEHDASLITAYQPLASGPSSQLDSSSGGQQQRSLKKGGSAGDVNNTDLAGRTSAVSNDATVPALDSSAARRSPRHQRTGSTANPSSTLVIGAAAEPPPPCTTPALHPSSSTGSLNESAAPAGPAGDPPRGKLSSIMGDLVSMVTRSSSVTGGTRKSQRLGSIALTGTADRCSSFIHTPAEPSAPPSPRQAADAAFGGRPGSKGMPGLPSVRSADRMNQPLGTTSLGPGTRSSSAALSGGGGSGRSADTDGTGGRTSLTTMSNVLAVAARGGSLATTSLRGVEGFGSNVHALTTVQQQTQQLLQQQQQMRIGERGQYSVGSSNIGGRLSPTARSSGGPGSGASAETAIAATAALAAASARRQRRLSSGPMGSASGAAAAAAAELDGLASPRSPTVGGFAGPSRMGRPNSIGPLGMQKQASVGAAVVEAAAESAVDVPLGRRSVQASTVHTQSLSRSSQRGLGRASLREIQEVGSGRLRPDAQDQTVTINYFSDPEVQPLSRTSQHGSTGSGAASDHTAMATYFAAAGSNSANKRSTSGARTNGGLYANSNNTGSDPSLVGMGGPMAGPLAAVREGILSGGPGGISLSRGSAAHAAAGGPAQLVHGALLGSVANAPLGRASHRDVGSLGRNSTRDPGLMPRSFSPNQAAMQRLARLFQPKRNEHEPPLHSQSQQHLGSQSLSGVDGNSSNSQFGSARRGGLATTSQALGSMGSLHAGSSAGGGNQSEENLSRLESNTPKSPTGGHLHAHHPHHHHHTAHHLGKEHRLGSPRIGGAVPGSAAGGAAAGGGIFNRSHSVGLQRKHTQGSDGGLPVRRAHTGLATEGGDVQEVDARGVGGLGAGAEHCSQLLLEYRLRLLMGLKQYFKAKHTNGSLSPSSFKVLSYSVDNARHMANKPLRLWDLARDEVSSGRWLQMEAGLYFQLKYFMRTLKKAQKRFWPVSIVTRLLSIPVRFLSVHLNQVTVSGLETATELWLSLTSSLQTQWLHYAGKYGAKLLEEAHVQAEAAYAFIIERRIEAPEKFQAILTHRAAIALLSHQTSFVKEMAEGGMIEEKESRLMLELVQKRLQLLSRQGPTWLQPTLADILANIPFLRGVQPRVIEWLRSHGDVKAHKKGDVLWEHWGGGDSPVPGMFIVIRGVVRLMMQTEGRLVPYYLGSGGVGGLVSMVLEDAVPGITMRVAYAEGNALGKGPVVLHVPPQLMQVVRRYSRDEGLAPYQQLELQMHRTAAGYVLDVLRAQVTAQLGLYLRACIAAIVDPDAWAESKAAKRVRLRSLLKEHIGAHDVGNEGGANIEWLPQLLDLQPAVAVALLLRDDDGSSSASDGGHVHDHDNEEHGDVFGAGDEYGWEAGAGKAGPVAEGHFKGVDNASARMADLSVNPRGARLAAGGPVAEAAGDSAGGVGNAAVSSSASMPLMRRLGLGLFNRTSAVVEEGDEVAGSGSSGPSSAAHNSATHNTSPGVSQHQLPAPHSPAHGARGLSTLERPKVGAALARPARLRRGSSGSSNAGDSDINDGGKGVHATDGEQVNGQTPTQQAVGSESGDEDGSITSSQLEALGSEPWVEAMLLSVASCTSEVYDSIRTVVREDSLLVVLLPGQSIVQTSTVVLIQGGVMMAEAVPPAGAHRSAGSIPGPFPGEKSPGLQQAPPSLNNSFTQQGSLFGNLSLPQHSALLGQLQGAGVNDGGYPIGQQSFVQGGRSKYHLGGRGLRAPSSKILNRTQSSLWVTAECAKPAPPELVLQASMQCERMLRERDAAEAERARGRTVAAHLTTEVERRWTSVEGGGDDERPLWACKEGIVGGHAQQQHHRRRHSSSTGEGGGGSTAASKSGASQSHSRSQQLLLMAAVPADHAENSHMDATAAAHKPAHGPLQHHTHLHQHHAPPVPNMFEVHASDAALAAAEAGQVSMHNIPAAGADATGSATAAGRGQRPRGSSLDGYLPGLRIDEESEVNRPDNEQTSQQEKEAHVHKAPSVMVWTSDYFDVQSATQAPMRLVAGERGATLLVCGADKEVLSGGA